MYRNIFRLCGCCYYIFFMKNLLGSFYLNFFFYNKLVIIGLGFEEDNFFYFYRGWEVIY